MIADRTQVFDARPPFRLLATLDTGPITNHVNIVRRGGDMFAYVTVGGLNQVKVFRTDDFSQVATIPVGSLPHSLWPSGDGSRVYVGLENADALTVIDTAINKVVATVPIGQAPQAGPTIRAANSSSHPVFRACRGRRSSGSRADVPMAVRRRR